MSDFSQFFVNSALPFRQVEPVYLTGFVRKFPWGSDIIPVPGTAYYFKLPSVGVTGVAGAYVTLVDNTNNTVIRTYTDIDYSGYTSLPFNGINGFYVDMMGSVPALIGFATNRNSGSAVVLKVVRMPADATTPASSVTSAEDVMPPAVALAFRGAYQYNGSYVIGVGFVDPLPNGHLRLRAIGPSNLGSSQITVDPSTAAWTNESDTWFPDAPNGHGTIYTTSLGDIACGPMLLDYGSLSDGNRDQSGLIEQFVTAGFHVDKVQFSGPSANFCSTTCSGVMPVLVGSKYIAMVTSRTKRFSANPGNSGSFHTSTPSTEPNLFMRSDIDRLLSDIRDYYNRRFGA